MPNVLIIDDEPGIRFALRRFLERQGWNVQESGDGEDALDRIRASPPGGDDQLDAILCDINLPKRSGESLVGVLEQERPELVPRVILTTGDDVHDAAAGSVLERHERVLQKPFDFLTLKAVLDDMRTRPHPGD